MKFDVNQFRFHFYLLKKSMIICFLKRNVFPLHPHFEGVFLQEC